jgi:hypothetical protein
MEPRPSPDVTALSLFRSDAGGFRPLGCCCRRYSLNVAAGEVSDPGSNDSSANRGGVPYTGWPHSIPNVQNPLLWGLSHDSEVLVFCGGFGHDARMVNLRTIARDQLLLMPPSLSDR